MRGYFDHLIRFVDHAVYERFIDPANRDLLVVDDSAEALLAKLAPHGFSGPWRKSPGP